MRDLSNLLARISRAIGNDQSLKEIVVTAIFERTKITLRPEDVSIKEAVLQIKTTPTKKNEIALHEAELLPLLSERLKRRLQKILYV